MAIELSALAALCAEYGPVARVVVAEVKGSAPREIGAAMLVWRDGQAGTIGGGALEYQAAEAARQQLGSQKSSLRHIPLGPDLGQCCGGAVSLLTEVFTPSRCAELAALEHQGLPFCRPVDRAVLKLDPTPPLAIRAGMARARAQGIAPEPQFMQGWMIEPFSSAALPLWIYGAGHVGRALVAVLEPLGYDICWVDTDQARFPAEIPATVTQLVAVDPARVVARAPKEARHLVLTFSHALDLEICHQILGHGFHSAGLIGSASKWARFRKRLAALGHSDAQINHIDCPIGLPELGKRPEAIAVGVATCLLRQEMRPCARLNPAKEPAL